MIEIFSMMMLTYVLAGCIGGLIRGLVGIRKALMKKSKSISVIPLLISIILAGIIGGFAAIFVSDGSMIIAFIAGYGGSDFLDNIYKTKLFGIFK